MASTDAAGSVQQSLKEEHSDAHPADLTSLKDPAPDTHGVHEAGKGAGERSGEASPAPSSPASGLSSTKSGTQPSSVPGQTSAPPLSMPHPKKFSHVNINKKFLEKTSASTPSHTFSASPVTKTASTSQKPVLQTSTSHPRLVTAKLTATPQPSTTTGPGWSRPSSAVSSSAPTPLPAGSTKGSPAPLTTPGGAPLPPPAGKVIQPQPRSSQDAATQRREASMKPVWGNTKSSANNSIKLDAVETDFPTAAEVAQGRIAKAAEKLAAADAAAVHKQAVKAELQAEEDTFRGVHLDPNAHHWDEMEEDDDNFLGGVIEFEDGRQYKVESDEASSQAQAQQDAKGPSGLTDQPVSKEERFADDFDRSWPRSRPPQHAPPGPPHEHRHEGLPVSPSTSLHSPQESSRVLFNERSNRLEPYSQRHAAPSGPFNRRGSRSDNANTPIEPRRDAPPHAHLSGIQVLQRGHHAEGQPFSRAPGDRPPVSPSDGSRFRDRAPFQRDNGWQGSVHHGSDRYGPHGSSHMPRDTTVDDQRRRTSGPEHPSVSPIGDHRRQLPPHLSALGPRHPPPIRQDPPTHPPAPSHVPAVQPEAPAPPAAVQHEPAAPSASSQGALSPAIPDKTLPVSTMPIVDMEEVRKAAMHSAAERARLRRQQEEAEREKERERARRKAAELEERIKAAEQEKEREREMAEAEKKRAESEVVGLIEEAVTSVSSSENKVTAVEGSAQRHPDPRSALGRNPSSRGIARPFGSRRTSFTPSTLPANPIAQPSPASEIDSWRRKNPPAAPAQAESQKPLATPVMPPPVLAHAGLDVKAGEEVEVLDFSDHAQLLGSEKPSQSAAPHAGRPARAVASDFFGDASPSQQISDPHQSRAEEETWRRGPPPRLAALTSPEEGRAGHPESHSGPSHERPPVPNGLPAVAPHSPVHEDHSRRVSAHHQNGMHRPPVNQSYREAPISTLNDTMARIKGAIAGMHHEHESKPEAPKAKWLPPALRSKSAHPDFGPPEEVFDVTSAEPPKSPKPAWNIFHVKLPHVSRTVAPPPRTELVWPRGVRQFRLEVYSFNPPIEALARRESTVNDVIFSRPRILRGQPKYFVSIPRRRLSRRTSTADTSGAPIVNLPSTPIRTRAPGLPKDSASSTASSWRKAPTPATTTWPPVLSETKEVAELDTVSRSPPPEAPSVRASGPSLPHTSEPVVVTVAASKAKVEPRMPVGSDVAFYRNSRVETTVQPQAPVQFIVSSELEGESRGQLKEANLPSSTESNATAPPTPPSKEPEPEHKTPIARISTTGTVTPPPQSQPTLSPWSKSPKAFTTRESPARAPDPEHLKAVWSQTPDKAQIQPVNSLKSIADDLTAVPFTLQDVKSDDGETPPPSGAGPWSRMSANEVTRAFQQVPSPSSSSSQRPTPIAPSSTSVSSNGSNTRHPGFAFSPPPMGQPALRPHAYPGYSPMVSQSPGPPAMYPGPSPVPRHVVPAHNGGMPAYGQAVWMPAMPGAAPPPSAGMVRSPYPPQYMPYPSPGAMPMYPGPMPMPNPPQQNGVQGRPPSMAMMSPVMQPAISPMYGSPVLVHTAPAVPPGQGYPMPNQANRAPMRGAYDQNAQNGAYMHPSPMRQPPQNGYAPIPSNYARPPW